MRIAPVVLIVGLGAALSGCGAPVDLKQVLQLEGLTGGYRDAGIVDGRNKVVPTITFRLKKSTDKSISPLSLNLAFKKLPLPGSTPAPGLPAEEEWDEAFTANVQFQGNETAPLTYKINAGFTGDPPQSRADILKNSHFQDVRVHIFAKHSSSQWIEIGQYDIPRQLITQ
ncbi:MAG TPA: hypothetical protein VH138_13850 [Vicinamibacterales bacterium]|jgi:hypothetical protein|nr:hypothetical protein [Vicinamibacterales bacterium]